MTLFTIKMRRFLAYTLSLFAITILLGACKREAVVVYSIGIDNEKHCTYVEQDITIEFTLQEESIANGVTPNVSIDSDWATVTETTSECVKFHVAKNDGEKRSATITIAANGYRTATVTLTQFSTPPAEANHTLMFLFLGTSLNRYFKDNLKDASTAIKTGILGNSNRVVFFRQDSEARAYIGELCYVGDECVEQRLEEIDIPYSKVTPELVSEYIALMAEYAPAKRYGLICAGHGQAWIPREVLDNDADIAKLSMGYDPWIQAAGAETTRAYGEKGARLNIPELATAIEESEVALDYILFDACFMSNIETAYDLRNVTNYIIASPCEIMGKGFPYERTLPYLFAEEGNATDYAGAAKSYHLYYRDEYSSNIRSGSIALINCTEIEALANATKRVVESATEDYDASKLQTYEGQRVHHFYDFGQWVNVVATDKEALKAFNEQLERCVIAKHTLGTFYSAYGNYGTYNIDIDVYSGVTTSAPSEAYPNAWHTTAWYNYVWGE